MPGPRHPSSAASTVRAGVATVEIVALGALAHASADGALPELGSLTALIVLVGAVSFALRRRLLSVRVAAVLAVGAQLVLHTAAATGGAHHGHHGHLTQPASATDADMLLAHVLSAVVTVLALVWQEQVVTTLARRLTRLPRALAPDTDVPSGPAGDHLVSVGGSIALLALAPRRGPPVAASAL